MSINISDSVNLTSLVTSTQRIDAQNFRVNGSEEGEVIDIMSTNTHGISIGYSPDANHYGVSIGYDPSAGENSIAIGKEAIANKDNCISIGRNAEVLASSGNNCISIGNSSKSYTEATNTCAISIGRSTECNGSGSISLGDSAVCDGQGCVNIGEQASIGSSAGTGCTNCIAIGNDAVIADGLTNSIAIGNGTSVIASNTIHLGNTSIGAIKGQVNFSAYSDIRDKTNINTINKGLDVINKLNPVTYEWEIRGGSALNGQTDIGFIAQECKQVMDETGFGNTHIVNTNDPDKYTICQTKIIPFLVKSIQELHSIIQSQNNTIEMLKNKLL